MTDPGPRTSRIPHWGWWLTGMFTLVIGVVAICFVLPIYQLQRTLAELRSRGCQIDYQSTEPPDWLPKWLRVDFGDDVKAVFSPSVMLTKRCGFCDADLVRLKGLTNLEGLELSHSQVTDFGIAQLARQNRLRLLLLDGTAITDQGLAHLREMNALESLNLDETRITDDGLAQLTGLAKLDILSLEQTQITDSGLIHLAGLANLQVLRLSGTKITDAGIGHLVGLPYLHNLWLDETHVTPTAVAKLKGAHPHREIQVFGPETRPEAIDGP